MKESIKSLGPFRWFLISCSFVLMGFAFLAAQWHDSINSSQKITIYISGSLVPIFFFVLLFDMMMNWIQMADKTPEQRQRFYHFTWIELVVLVMLIFCWLPFFHTLFA